MMRYYSLKAVGRQEAHIPPSTPRGTEAKVVEMSISFLCPVTLSPGCWTEGTISVE